MDVSGMHVVVTGASRGIGAALAREATRRGATVTMVARSSDHLKTLADELGATAMPADLGQADEVDGLVARIEDASGPVDVLINNAGLIEVGPFATVDEDAIRRHVDVNLVAPLRLTRQVLPGMLDRNRGSIVTVSSIVSEFSMRNFTNYSAAKAGLSQFTQNLQRELKGTPLDVLLVYLGAIKTEMYESTYKDPHVAGVASRFTMLKALGTESVADQLLTAVGRRKKFLTLPKVMAPVISVRRAPSRLTDLLADRNRAY